MNFTEASEKYLHDLENRQVRRSSLKSYESILRVHLRPRWGGVPLQDLAVRNNRVLKELVQELRVKYRPASIQAICLVFKQVLDHLCDDNGVRLFRCEWSRSFAGIPPIVPTDQKAPIISAAEIDSLVANHADAPLYALLAGTGLRIGECLALTPADWDREAGILHVKASKTPAGLRDVDLPMSLNKWLMGRLDVRNVHDRLFPGCLTAYRDRARGVTGPFHSFRRYRLTHLRKMGMPEDLLRFALGHADRSISDRYSRLRLDCAFRREWVERVGLGFTL